MIQIFITGGTFDKSYNHISGDLFFDKTHIPEMLKRSKCRLNIEVKTLMMIDSLEMTEKDNYLYFLHFFYNITSILFFMDNFKSKTFIYR